MPRTTAQWLPLGSGPPGVPIYQSARELLHRGAGLVVSSHLFIYFILKRNRLFSK